MAVNLPRYRVILDTFAFRNRSTDLHFVTVQQIYCPRDNRYVRYGVHMSQPASPVVSRSCTDT